MILFVEEQKKNERRKMNPVIGYMVPLLLSKMTFNPASFISK